ncbi:MAG: methyltransferase domain-containing protein [Betaproteobacteria bacterium]|nr:methyltransferase domain-containing protein [Betaproteobacteria bacterium]
MLAVVLFIGGLASHAADDSKSGGPYVPTPQVVVDQMLFMAGIKSSDYVIDLGSGDGVIVLTAARLFKASGMGVDIDPELVKLSNDAARKFGVADRVHFLLQDVFKADLSKASVVTLYLLPGMMLSLREKIFNELKPGARVVSHDYHFGEWPPDDQMSFDVPEKEAVNGVPMATIYLWRVPARVAGKWQVRVAGGETYELTLKQRFQNVEGSVTTGGKALRPQYLTLRGDEFTFALPDGKGSASFTGRVKGGTMEGSVELPGAKSPARWSASRTAAAKVITD